MKTSSLTMLLLALGMSVYAQSEHLEISSCDVKVYTDNGAYVKAKSTNAATIHFEFTYTEEYVKNGKKYESESSYSFNIAPNESKQLFFSQNGVTKLTFVKCQATDSQGQSSTPTSRRQRAHL